MKTANTILRELIPGQASTDVLAEQLRQPAKVLIGFLADLEVDALVERSNIKDTITVWRLTDLGREAANTLNLQPA